MEEEQRSNMFNLRLINKMRSQTPCATPITYTQDEMIIHDFDRAMVNVSIWLAQDLMVDRIIWNIGFFMTKKGYENITNERHHLVTPELLAREWVIVFEKCQRIR